MRRRNTRPSECLPLDARVAAELERRGVLLTACERDTLAGTIAGCDLTVVALRRGVGVDTAKKQAKAVCRKLGASCIRAAAIDLLRAAMGVAA